MYLSAVDDENIFVPVPRVFLNSEYQIIVGTVNNDLKQFKQLPHKIKNSLKQIHILYIIWVGECENFNH